MEVELTKYELKYAEYIAKMRNTEALKVGKKNKFGLPNTEDDDLQIHKIGAAGEMALAKAMNWYFNGHINTYKIGYDVYKTQVRTATKSSHRLIVREDDKSDDIFVLVLKDENNEQKFQIKGWLKGSQAKNNKYLQNPHNWKLAYFVPQSELNPISTLSAAINEV